jgi:aldose 1-epimerase
MLSPTGVQVEVSGGGYAATITQVGATLRELRHRGRALVAGFDPAQPMPTFNGALLAPWPNRIADGSYEFDGTTYQLPISEPARNTALHGLVAWQAWDVRSAGPDRAELGTVLYPQRGYPFLLTLTARFTAADDGLRIDISARNDGASDAPYGISMHPWFLAPPEPLRDWTLTLPARQVLTVDDRLLPTGSQPTTGKLDYTAGRLLGDTALDHTFTDLAFVDGVATARLVSPEGAGIELSWGSQCRWLQVCTGDEAGPEVNRRAVAIEPMTCPPDAFRSGVGLIRLAPGQTNDVWWRITAVG